MDTVKILASTSIVCLEFVFFEDELIIYFLYIWEIEVWLCEYKASFRWLSLKWLVKHKIR